MNEDTWYRWEADDLVISLHVQPRAKRDEVVGPVGAQLRVRITAPPVEGKANEHLRRFLGTVFGVPASRVLLVQGERGRTKRLRICGPSRLPGGVDRR